MDITNVLLNKNPPELRRFLKENQNLLVAVFVFSFFVNALMLTGPIFMLQIYDRVLSSRSEETLVALVLLVTFLFLLMGLLDYSRGRVMARVGAKFQLSLNRNVFSAVLRETTQVDTGTNSSGGLKALEDVQRLFTSPVFFVMFDIIWTPVFLLLLFIFHPWIGFLGVIGGAILIFAALLNQRFATPPAEEANSATTEASQFAGKIAAHAELLKAQGMHESFFARWRSVSTGALVRTVLASDKIGAFSAFSRTFRLFLQASVFGLGAYLVLQGEITAGVMIAASIILGRALAPVDQLIGNWILFVKARQGWIVLKNLLSRFSEGEKLITLPPPRAILRVETISVLPPGASQNVLNGISFSLDPGQALAVIGPSGAGKSALASALTGIWPLSRGEIRIDGAALDHYGSEDFGKYIGYLPQKVDLFPASIAENIARMRIDYEDVDVINAAKKVGAHEMILRLPQGYDTQLNQRGGGLSGGQIQRIGLARAIFGDPAILFLDEPNSSLDEPGAKALNTAIHQAKKAGKAVVIMTHRPLAIAECELLLIIEGGIQRAFGERDVILKRYVQNHQQIKNDITSKSSK